MTKPQIAITYLKLDELVQQSEVIALAEGTVPGTVVCKKLLLNPELYRIRNPEGSTWTILSPIPAGKETNARILGVRTYMDAPAAAARQILF